MHLVLTVLHIFCLAWSIIFKQFSWSEIRLYYFIAKTSYPGPIEDLPFMYVLYVLISIMSSL